MSTSTTSSTTAMDTPLLDKPSTPAPALSSPPQHGGVPSAPILSLLIGVVFGTAFTLAHINESYYVRQQFTFHTNIMLKMFIAAAATSTLVITHLSTYAQYTSTLDRLSQYHRSLQSTIIGAALIGLGMYLSGSCPGTVYSQLGTMSYSALYTFLGCLIGALLYGLADTFDSFVQWQYSQNSYGAIQIYKQLGVSQTAFGYTMALAMYAAVIALEFLFPNTDDIYKLYSDIPAYTILPSLAGVMVGSLQLPLVTLLGKHLGTSASYCTVVCNIRVLHISSYISRNSTQFKQLKSSYLTLYMCIGIVIGAMLVSRILGYTYVSDLYATSTLSLRCVLGGILLTIGARMGNGCTSGLGLSMVGHSTVAGYVGAAAMFGTAILAATFM